MMVQSNTHRLHMCGRLYAGSRGNNTTAVSRTLARTSAMCAGTCKLATSSNVCKYREVDGAWLGPTAQVQLVGGGGVGPADHISATVSSVDPQGEQAILEEAIGGVHAVSSLLSQVVGGGGCFQDLGLWLWRWGKCSKCQRAATP